LPELPEVETMVRGIDPVVRGRQIVAISECPTACKPLTIVPGLSDIQQALVGQTVAAVTRIGKRVVWQMANELTLAIEPRMTGLMLLSDPPDEAHLRLRFDLKLGKARSVVWFWDRRGLGTVKLYQPGEFERTVMGQLLGTDALSMTASHWKKLCASTDRPIKVLLLDQKRVAGIGNLYASEILHAAQIHPAVPASSLRPKQILELDRFVRSILQMAIEYEGSTLGDGTYRNALNQSGSYQNAHQVYARVGELCQRCGGSIERFVQAQRATFFCPGCQVIGKHRKR
jgi:formamidopyrimidine-DNA glycosylase